jgi:hypothetical protein
MQLALREPHPDRGHSTKATLSAPKETAPPASILRYRFREP